MQSLYYLIQEDQLARLFEHQEPEADNGASVENGGRTMKPRPVHSLPAEPERILSQWLIARTKYAPVT